MLILYQKSTYSVERCCTTSIRISETGLVIMLLKWVKTNLTFSWHSGFEGHKFLHFLSHFGKKKSKNVLPIPGFEPAIRWCRAHCANHYTTDTYYGKLRSFKLIKDVCYINRSRLRFSSFLEFWGCSDHWDFLHSFLMY